MAQLFTLQTYIPPQKTKTVAISGCFDIIHIGHIRFISAARATADALVLLLESDAFIQKYKNRTPFHTQQERAEILSHIKEIDYIVLLPFMTKEMAYIDMWKKIHPSIIAVTKGDPYLDVKKQQALEIGADIIEVTPLIPHKSTTDALQQHPSRKTLE